MLGHWQSLIGALTQNLICRWHAHATYIDHLQIFELESKILIKIMICTGVSCLA